jgi:hypothetical protein
MLGISQIYKEVHPQFLNQIAPWEFVPPEADTAQTTQTILKQNKRGHSP